MRRKTQDLQILFIDLFIDLSDLFTFNWTLSPKDVSIPQNQIINIFSMLKLRI